MQVGVVIVSVWLSFMAADVGTTDQKENQAVEQMPAASRQQSYPQTLPDVIVLLNNFAFSPLTITIRKGRQVKWINEDSVSHTVTGFGIDKTLYPGEILFHTFHETGMYPYRCTIHEGMSGVVLVIPED